MFTGPHPKGNVNRMSTGSRNRRQPARQRMMQPGGSGTRQSPCNASAIPGGTRADFTPVSYARALDRAVAGYMLAWVGLPLLLSVLWPLWNARNQTLADKWASTVVLRRS